MSAQLAEARAEALHAKAAQRTAEKMFREEEMLRRDEERLRRDAEAHLRLMQQISLVVSLYRRTIIADHLAFKALHDHHFLCVSCTPSLTLSHTRIEYADERGCPSWPTERPELGSRICPQTRGLLNHAYDSA